MESQQQEKKKKKTNERERENVIRIIIFIWYIEFLYRTISISNETTTLWAIPLNINYQITVDFGKIYAIVHIGQWAITHSHIHIYTIQCDG